MFIFSVFSGLQILLWIFLALLGHVHAHRRTILILLTFTTFVLLQICFTLLGHIHVHRRIVSVLLFSDQPYSLVLFIVTHYGRYNSIYVAKLILIIKGNILRLFYLYCLLVYNYYYPSSEDIGGLQAVIGALSTSCVPAHCLLAFWSFIQYTTKLLQTSLISTQYGTYLGTQLAINSCLACSSQEYFKTSIVPVGTKLPKGLAASNLLACKDVIELTSLRSLSDYRGDR